MQDAGEDVAADVHYESAVFLPSGGTSFTEDEFRLSFFFCLFKSTKLNQAAVYPKRALELTGNSKLSAGPSDLFVSSALRPTVTLRQLAAGGIGGWDWLLPCGNPECRRCVDRKSRV